MEATKNNIAGKNEMTLKDLSCDTTFLKANYRTACTL